MAIPPQTRLTEEERASLIAFLDGEAEPALAQKIEEKAAKSPSVRRELAALEKTWAMLDWLPRPQAPGDFATQTITRIYSLRLHAQLVEGRLKVVLAWVAKGLAWAACIMASAAIGFGTLRFFWRDPSAELIQHLEILENMEAFRAIPDLKFLEDLSILGVFVEPAAPLETGPISDAAGGGPATGNAPGSKTDQ